MIFYYCHDYEFIGYSPIFYGYRSLDCKLTKISTNLTHCAYKMYSYCGLFYASGTAVCSICVSHELFPIQNFQPANCLSHLYTVF